jgi:hypothetical protein
VYNTSKFCGALKINSVAHAFLWRTEAPVRHKNLNSVAHGSVSHRNLIFVATFLWRTPHAPQNPFLVRH